MYIGDNKIQSVFYGLNKINKIYCGSEVVWTGIHPFFMSFLYTENYSYNSDIVKLKVVDEDLNVKDISIPSDIYTNFKYLKPEIVDKNNKIILILSGGYGQFGELKNKIFRVDPDTGEFETVNLDPNFTNGNYMAYGYISYDNPRDRFFIYAYNNSSYLSVFDENYKLINTVQGNISRFSRKESNYMGENILAYVSNSSSYSTIYRYNAKTYEDLGPTSLGGNQIFTASQQFDSKCIITLYAENSIDSPVRIQIYNVEDDTLVSSTSKVISDSIRSDIYNYPQIKYNPNEGCLYHYRTRVNGSYSFCNITKISKDLEVVSQITINLDEDIRRYYSDIKLVDIYFDINNNMYVAIRWANSEYNGSTYYNHLYVYKYNRNGQQIGKIKVMDNIAVDYRVDVSSTALLNPTSRYIKELS